MTTVFCGLENGWKGVDTETLWKVLQRYFIVGIVNSAPDRIPVGQRDVIAFCRV